MKSVEVELGGVKRRLALDLNAQIAFQSRTGQNIFEIGSQLAAKKYDLDESGNPIPGSERSALGLAEMMKLVRMLVWGMLASDCPQFEADPHSMTTVGSWLNGPEDLGPLLEKILPLVADYSEHLSKRIKPEFEGAVAPYVPSPRAVVARMIEAAELKPGMKVVDCGAGDGRLMFAAAEFCHDLQVIGYELHNDRYEAIRRKIAGHSRGLSMHVVNEDLRSALLSQTDVVFLYLMPKANTELKPYLLENMKPGAKVISHDFDMPDWEPDSKIRLIAEDRTHTIYVWTIPPKYPLSDTQAP